MIIPIKCVNFQFKYLKFCENFTLLLKVNIFYTSIITTFQTFKRQKKFLFLPPFRPFPALDGTPALRYNYKKSGKGAIWRHIILL